MQPYAYKSVNTHILLDTQSRIAISLTGSELLRFVLL